MSDQNEQALIQQYIGQFSLAEHLNRDLLRCLRLFHCKADAEVYRQDNTSSYVYLLVSGKLQVNYIHQNGKVSILANLEPLTLVGEVELFYNLEMRMNIIAIENSILLGIEKAFAIRYGYDDPRFLRFVIQNLTSKLYDSSTILTRTILPLSGQVAAYLLDQPTNTDGKFTLESKLYLSGLMGTTTRHLNRVFKTLETENIIRLERDQVEILDREALVHYTEL